MRASRTRASASRMRAFARRVSARDFSKRILIDSLIPDFEQLARGSFSSSVARVLRMWFVFWSAIRVFRIGSCFSSVVRVRLNVLFVYTAHPQLWLPVQVRVLASSSSSTREFEREFECEYSRVRERVRVLASSRASVHTRNLTHACALLSLVCLALARLQYSRVALRVTRVARTRLLTCGWAAL